MKNNIFNLHRSIAKFCRDTKNKTNGASQLFAISKNISPSPLQVYRGGGGTNLHEVNYEIYKFMPEHDFCIEVCDQETDIITLKINEFKKINIIMSK